LQVLLLLLLLRTISTLLVDSSYLLLLLQHSLVVLFTILFDRTLLRIIYIYFSSDHFILFCHCLFLSAPLPLIYYSVSLFPSTTNICVFLLSFSVCHSVAVVVVVVAAATECSILFCYCVFLRVCVWSLGPPSVFLFLLLLYHSVCFTVYWVLYRNRI
jgi:hypothetical protein